jgi:hypothetical protein
MTKETRKRKKAIKKLDTAVQKAVDRGISQAVIEGTVEQAIGKHDEKGPEAETAALGPDDPDAEPATSKSAKKQLKKLSSKSKAAASNRKQLKKS